MLRLKRLDRTSIAIALAVTVAVLLLGAGLLMKDSGGVSRFDRLGTMLHLGGQNGAPAGEVSGSVVGTSAIVGKDRTEQSLAPSRTAESNVPAADGAKLETITTPPAQTLAMVSRDGATAGSAYDIAFWVYGIGPSSGTIGTAVILVFSSAPVDDVAKPFEFKNRNVLVRLDPDTQAALTHGGSYRGVITLRLTGDTLIPWLGDVSSGP